MFNFIQVVHAASEHVTEEHSLHTPGVQGEVIFDLGWMQISNILLTSWIVMLVIILGSLYINRVLRANKNSRLQNFIEMIVESFDALFTSFTLDVKKTRRWYAYLVTLFVFITLSNWFGVMIDWFIMFMNEGKDTFRSPFSDLSSTLSFALLTFVLTQYYGFKYLGWAYLGKFINFSGKNIADRFLNLFIGVVETISELAKVLSLSLRLFGNIFAGLILLSVIFFLLGDFPAIMPLPFFFMEIGVGLIQGTVFMGLSMIYFVFATKHH